MRNSLDAKLAELETRAQRVGTRYGRSPWVEAKITEFWQLVYDLAKEGKRPPKRTVDAYRKFHAQFGGVAPPGSNEAADRLWARSHEFKMPPGKGGQ